MRNRFNKQLEQLHTELIYMGALCEDAIACAAKALLEGDDFLRQKAIAIEEEINQKERAIDDLRVRLLLLEQPVAGDLRQLNAAGKLVIDMERIGDQAADIAELSGYMKNSSIKSDIHIGDMARATIKMVTDSIDSFVEGDLEKAHYVINYDDVVDDLFDKVRSELIALIAQNSSQGGACLDLLMIAKYFERIGDHAVNIAEWVVYSITGERTGGA